MPASARLMDGAPHAHATLSTCTGLWITTSSPLNLRHLHENGGVCMNQPSAQFIHIQYPLNLCPDSSLHLDLQAHRIKLVNINSTQLLLFKTSKGKRQNLNCTHLQCKWWPKHPSALSANQCNSCPCLYLYITHLPASAFKILTFHCSKSSSYFQKGSDLDVHHVPFHLFSSERKHPTDENYTGCSAEG